jgi:hypothetical protein
MLLLCHLDLPDRNYSIVSCILAFLAGAALRLCFLLLLALLVVLALALEQEVESHWLVAG